MHLYGIYVPISRELNSPVKHSYEEKYNFEKCIYVTGLERAQRAYCANMERQ